MIALENISPGPDPQLELHETAKSICDFDFDFGEATAAVFDDMLDRSIPEYRELQRMIGELAAIFSEPGTRVYDLGCSTGITIETLAGAIQVPVQFVGMDYSPPMLERAHERLSGLVEAGRLELREADLNCGVQVENASVVALNLTLQFVSNRSAPQ